MQLRTARLILREFRSDDLDAIVAYQADPRYRAAYPGESRGEDESRSLLDRFIAWQHESPRTKFQLAITLPPNDACIGNVGLRLAEPGATTAELGYELHPDHWGHGYATEACREMLRFGFEELRLRGADASVHADNRGSIRVLEKLGFYACPTAPGAVSPLRTYRVDAP